MKTRYFLISIIFILSMVMTACQPAAPAAPAAPEKPAAEAPAAPAEAPAATEKPAAEAPAAPAAPEKADVCAQDEFGCAKIAPGTKIKIGMGAPMTGDNAQFGIDISQGTSIALQDAGDIDGFEFELVTQDDGGTPEGGAAVANKLVSDPNVVAIAGHIFSGATDAAMPIYEDKGIPMMSPSATNPPLTQKGSRVFNRVAFTDMAQGQGAAEYLYNKLGVRKLATMHDGQPYGQGLVEVVTEKFTELGGEIVASEAITPGETDYSAPLSAIAAKGPEAVYYGGYVQEGVILANQWKQSGLEGVIFFSCEGVYGEDFRQRTGANGEGVYAVSLIPAASDAVTKFNEAYESQFGAAPGTLSPYSWTAYDSGAVLAAAIKSVAFLGDDGNLYIPRGALVKAVRETKDFQGLSGVLTCDAVGECNASGPLFYVIKDGQWVIAE